MESYAVTGSRVYDTRIVAAMIVHGLTHILTFNVGDFARYREIVVVSPDQLLRERNASGP